MGQPQPQPPVKVGVHPRTEQIHLHRDGTRIGLVIDMDELADIIDQLVTIRDTWPLRRAIEQEHDERISRSTR